MRLVRALCTKKNYLSRHLPTHPLTQPIFVALAVQLSSCLSIRALFSNKCSAVRQRLKIQDHLCRRAPNDSIQWDRIKAAFSLLPANDRPCCCSTATSAHWASMDGRCSNPSCKAPPEHYKWWGEGGGRGAEERKASHRNQPWPSCGNRHARCEMRDAAQQLAVL